MCGGCDLNIEFLRQFAGLEKACGAVTSIQTLHSCLAIAVFRNHSQHELDGKVAEEL